MTELEFEPNYDYILWESTFSKFVAEVYGRPFNYQQWELLGQDTYFEFEIESEYTESDYAEARQAVEEWQVLWVPTDDYGKQLDAVREQGVYLELLTIDLHARGYLPVGRYLMKVWW